MKALVLEKNGVIKYSEVSEPVVGPDECLVAVKSSGICNSDIFRAYNNGAYFYPLIMGHEFSGVVLEAGKEVSKFKKGDRVSVFPLLPCNNCRFCKTNDYAQCINYGYYGSRQNGAFAERIAVKEWNLFRLPDSIDLDSAALLEPISVAMHAVRKVKFNVGSKIAILGAGVIGLTMAEYFSNHVHKENIYVVDRNDFKLALARDLGIQTINAGAEGDWPRSFEGEAGVDFAVEASGAIELFRNSLKIVKPKGKVVWVGNIQGDLGLDKKLVSSILRREIFIEGSWNSIFNHQNDDDWNFALKYIEGAKILNKLITKKIGLNEGEKAFERLFESKQRCLGAAKNPELKVMFGIGDK